MLLLLLLAGLAVVLVVVGIPPLLMGQMQDLSELCLAVVVKSWGAGVRVRIFVRKENALRRGFESHISSYIVYTYVRVYCKNACTFLYSLRYLVVYMYSYMDIPIVQ